MLQRIDSVNDGDENLIIVEFSDSRDKKPEQFCTIKKWSNTKLGAENEIIKFNVKKVKKEYMLVPIVNGKEQNFNYSFNPYYTYKIMSIINIF